MIKELENASIFELWRLNCAMWKMIKDPVSLEKVRRQLKLGLRVSYFDDEANQLIDAIIIEVKRNKVKVQEIASGKIWTMPFHMLNLDKVDTAIDHQHKSGHLNRNNLKLGDHVGWINKSGEDFFGVVIKLNPKMAKIQLSSGAVWSVAYCLLFQVVEGSAQAYSDPFLIEGEVISA